MNKRGLSVVLETALFILITIVAIGILWAGYNKFIKKGSSGNSFDCTTIDLEPTTCIFLFNQTDLNGDNIPDIHQAGLLLNFKRALGNGEIDDVKIVANAVSFIGNSLQYQTYILEPHAINNNLGSVDNYYGNLVELTSDDAANLGGIPELTAVLDANIVAVVGSTVCDETNEPVECKCAGPNPLNLIQNFEGFNTCGQEFGL